MKPTQLSIQTKAGNTLQLFYNPANNLLVIDLVHANERGGNEVVRMTLNEKQMLAHCEPAIEVAAVKVVEFADKTLKTKRVSAKRDIRTPQQWCDFFGVRVIDPDGWRHDEQLNWDTPITRDIFRERYQLSTCSIVDPTKYAQWKHYLG